MPLDYQVITDSYPSSVELSDCLTQLVEAAVSVNDADVIHAIYGTFTGAAAVIAGALNETPVALQTFGRDVTLGASADDRYRRLMNIAYGRADLVIASDTTIADVVARDYSVDLSRLRVLPPGLNFSKVRQIARGVQLPTRSQARILTVQSSFNQAKGLGILVHAFSLLRDRLPDAELVVVGHDDTPGARIDLAIRELARELKVDDRINFTGHMDHDDVARTMAGCDVLVDPRIINSFSTCVYEAMTVGVPVVASDIPCNHDALGGGSRGELVSVGDAADMARGIESVLISPARADALRRAGEAHVAEAEQEFGSDVVAENLLEMYRMLLSGSA
jgi:glycosyltransferase involved in cell wall biosynthesis